MPNELEAERRALVAKGPGDAAESTSETGLDLLPIVKKADDHPCFDCSLCCRYVAIEIDEPTSMRDYDHVYWYLYHGGVSVFVDWNGDWFIQLESRCHNLTDQGLCSIYERRPAICKEFDWRECEKNVDEPPDKHTFRTAEDFDAWFQKKRPKAYQRYRRFLRKQHAKGEEPERVRLERRTKIRKPKSGARSKSR